MTPDQKKKKSAEIWKTLSAVDVSAHTEKRQGLTYLSWSWAWSVLMQHYPDAEYSFERFDGTDVMTYADGSCAVFCSVTIEGITREMSLPVFDHRFKPITNPDSAQINKNRMRCLVKCIGLFGLGLYIYAGDDLPTPPPVEQPEKKPAAAKPSRPRTAALPTPQAQSSQADLAQRIQAKRTLEELYADDALRHAIKALQGSPRAELISAWQTQEERFGGSPKTTRPDFDARDNAGVGRVRDVVAAQ